jgi:thiamine biosynthesis lipoprotein
MKNLFFLILPLIVLAVIVSCDNSTKKVYRYYEGPIQGTYFHIAYEWNKDLSHEIDSLLKNFNKSLSNYDSISVISKLNYNLSDEVDELFKKMFKKSFEVYKITDGAFDITIAPIANLWGFGWKRSFDWIKSEDNEIPDSALIAETLVYVGMDKVKIKNNKLIKTYPETMFISNAIAQGLSVDYLADYFFKLGLKNFLIEIGGEIYSYGLNSKGEKWKIGIDKPIEGTDYSNRENQIVISISSKGIATSGNYRKYKQNGNKKYGHSLDPRTGYPAENSLLSVTVVADDCMTADAFATAFMVMGLEKSLKIIDSLKKIDAYFIFLDQQGKERVVYSDGFGDYLK